jgi:hypothetical protein
VTRKGQSITLSVSEQDKAQLEAIAHELGMLWGDAPNISRLIKAIARRQLLICPNYDWSCDRLNSLNQARLALVDAGQMDAALDVAQLLLERSELAIPLRQEIQQFLDAPTPPWRQVINRYIGQQQPFQLSYRDAADRLWSFSIRHARVTLYEKREYLECWCEEIEGNQDISELAHNWSLRLDRINEAAIDLMPAKWKPTLDQVEVEFHLNAGLAFAYSPRPDDIICEWLTNPSQVKRVVRRISSTFWFIREVLRYGAECRVISPKVVCDRVHQQVQAMIALYEH